MLEAVKKKKCEGNRYACMPDSEAPVFRNI